MKKINLFYWIITGLMAAFMISGALMDVIKNPDAVALIKHLGYPGYFVPFIGLVKITGVIFVLIPRFPRLKEWAYAGLVFDTSGALFSHISVGDGPDKWMPALLALLLISVSYFLHVRRNVKKQTA